MWAMGDGDAGDRVAAAPAADVPDAGVPDAGVPDAEVTWRSWLAPGLELVLLVVAVLLMHGVAGTSWPVAVCGVLGIRGGLALGAWMRRPRAAAALESSPVDRAPSPPRAGV